MMFLPWMTDEVRFCIWIEGKKFVKPSNTTKDADADRVLFLFLFLFSNSILLVRFFLFLTRELKISLCDLYILVSFYFLFVYRLYYDNEIVSNLEIIDLKWKPITHGSKSKHEQFGSWSFLLLVLNFDISGKVFGHCGYGHLSFPIISLGYWCS